MGKSIQGAAEMTYDFPLVTWINMALHKTSLKTMVETLRANKPLDPKKEGKYKESNTKYLEKILREEVVKQFNDQRRPALEVILNAIDAKPKGFTGEYNVRVSLKRHNIIVSDNGTSLNLDQVLSLLIIPFHTEKNGIDEIGRFGVGFLSNFYYCVNDLNVSIVVETDTGKEAFKIVFYSLEENVSGLRMSITKRATKKEGTTVSIKGLKYNKEGMLSYLPRNLANIPTYLCRIHVNKFIVNEGGFEWFSEPVTLNIRGKEVTQSVAIRRTSKIGVIELTAQGVRVKTASFIDDKEGSEKNKSMNYSGLGAVISFPSAVQVVEGRDEFKIDQNYYACIKSIFKALEKYIKSLVIDEAERYRLACFIPALYSALEVPELKMISNLNSICNRIFPNCEYAIPYRILEAVEEFISKKLKDKCFPCSIAAITFWSEIYKEYDDFIENHMKPILEANHKSTQKFWFINKNLNFLYFKLRSFEGYHLSLAPVRTDPGARPIHYDAGYHSRPRIYVNLNHPMITGGYNHLKAYSLLSEFLNCHNIGSLEPNCVSFSEDKERLVQQNIEDLVTTYSFNGYLKRNSYYNINSTE